MTAVLALPGDVCRDEWLARRRRFLGGSDIAAVLNVSPYDGPLSTWMAKVHGRTKAVTDAMSIGTHMEPWIMRKFASVNPTLSVVTSPGMFVEADDLDDSGQPWRAATPDGVATLPDGREAYVEAKTARRYGDDTGETWGEEGTDEIPYAYLCQVTWVCALRRLPLWVVPVLFDGCDYREYRGRYEPELGKTLVDYGRRWWNRHVVGGEEPPADHRESTRHLLTERFERQPGATKKTYAQVDDPSTLLHWSEYCRLREQISALSVRKDEQANLLRQAHVRVDVAELRDGDRTISTFTATKTGSFRLNVKEFAA